MSGRQCNRECNAGSSSGRTLDFESGYGRSNRSPATSSLTILKFPLRPMAGRCALNAEIVVRVHGREPELWSIGRMADQWMINLPDKDLAYLPQGTEHFEDYVRAVHWAQDYALANRDLMMRNLIAAVQASGEAPAFEANVEVVSCHHNYVTWEHHYGENVLITRKGAVRAREGDMGIIPGSMGARSYIVRGKGNPESFMSCSHGAGRAMSRTEAKRRFTLDDHAKATAGVECRKDADVIDETPMAYKSIDAVMEAQRDLVDVVHTLRQVVCVKG